MVVLRPSQPDQIKEDIGVGGILIYGEKGIISCNDYGTRAKLYIGGEVVDKVSLMEYHAIHLIIIHLGLKLL